MKRELEDLTPPRAWAGTYPDESMSARKPRRKRLTMRFQPSTIEHLGAKLYPTLPPVIGELVSNAWDADAKTVRITVPEGEISSTSTVVVKDDGSGMTWDQLADEYLKIGRNRRGDGSDRSESGERTVMGRKGLGKLSAFGVADVLELRTVRDERSTTIRLDYNKMKAWGRGDYPAETPEEDSPTREKSGTEVRIRELRRSRPIDVALIRLDISRRFGVLGKGFEVFVNDKVVQSQDRRTGCDRTWTLAETPTGDQVDKVRGWTVKGWAGLSAKSSGAGRGLDIIVRGRAVEMDTFFGLPHTHAQYARAYIVGQVDADFLDLGPADQISTGRASVQWDTEEGIRLQDWGQGVVKWLFQQWLALRKKKKEEALVSNEGFRTWLKGRSEREQRLATRLVQSLVDKDEVEVEAVLPLLEVVKSNIEFQAFQELVDELDTVGGDVPTLIRLVGDWNILEAREALKLSDGRMSVIEQLSHYIVAGALEVQEIQPLFRSNPWLVEPGWGQDVRTEVRFSRLLQGEFPDDPKAVEGDRRIDLLAYDAAANFHVVELKEPKHVLKRSDLDQLAAYVDFVRNKIAKTAEDRPVRGLLIVGDVPKRGDLVEYRGRLLKDGMSVITYQGIVDRAEAVYGQLERHLKEVAPEYTRTSRKERRKRAA